MRWSIKIGRVAGIHVFAHATFLILVAWLVIGDLSAGRGWSAALGSVATLMILFATIVLHELGHALTARQFGVRTSRITLLPIGGVAEMEEIPRNPVQELVVALAGPAVNVVLAASAALLLIATGNLAHLGQLDEILPRFILMNVSIAVFNMLPAFPMDAGQAFKG